MIGLKKCAMLRKLTVCQPEFTVHSYRSGAVAQFWHGTILEPRYQAPGFGTGYNTRWCGSTITIDPALVLEKAGKLRQLRICNPLLGIKIPSCPLDQSRFEELEVTVINLYQGSSALFDQKRRQAITSAAEANAKHGSRWQWQMRRIDEFGCYA